MDLKERVLVSGCPGEEGGWNTQLLYFTGSSLSRDDKSLFLISDRDGTRIPIPSIPTTGGISSSTAEAAVTSRFTAWMPVKACYNL